MFMACSDGLIKSRFLGKVAIPDIEAIPDFDGNPDIDEQSTDADLLSWKKEGCGGSGGGERETFLADSLEMSSVDFECNRGPEEADSVELFTIKVCSLL
jgi:hypothetical protein